jgi:uncharacterized protein (DUF952 family)
MIYHITTKLVWAEALINNHYSGDTLISEGFIHCSNAEQVNGSLNKHFKGKTELILLCINENKLKEKFVFENLAGGDNLFPHIYGKLNIDAVENAIEITSDLNGINTLNLDQ